jgi:haloacid dehalogenase-like hydrolase
MMTRRTVVHCFLSLAITASLLGPAARVIAAPDPLPSWQNAEAKQRILRFVAEVTGKNNRAMYVRPEERIATFDVDGTLWCEKPASYPAMFLIRRTIEMSPQHPEWATRQPFRAVIEQDFPKLGKLTEADVMELLVATHTGMTEDEFSARVEAYLNSNKDKRFGVLYKQLAYQPQLELMRFLENNQFQIFLCADAKSFIRCISEEVFGVPRDRVIGSDVQVEYNTHGGSVNLVRMTSRVPPPMAGPGKPIHIQRQIGRRPILAFGNSDADIEMLQFTRQSSRPSLSLLLHHDDAEREYAYDTGAEKILVMAPKQSWVVVSMKQDFRQVFVPQGK